MFSSLPAPNNTMVGIPKLLARCAGPESVVKTAFADAISSHKPSRLFFRQNFPTGRRCPRRSATSHQYIPFPLASQLIPNLVDLKVLVSVLRVASLYRAASALETASELKLTITRLSCCLIGLATQV